MQAKAPNPPDVWKQLYGTFYGVPRSPYFGAPCWQSREGDPASGVAAAAAAAATMYAAAAAADAPDADAAEVGPAVIDAALSQQRASTAIQHNGYFYFTEC